MDQRPHAPPRPALLRLLVIAAFGLALAACAPGAQLDASRLQVEVAPTVSGSVFVIRIPESRPATGVVVRRAGVETFSIPPGHYPPRGMCRVWRAGLPPGQQDPPASCSELEPRTPAGAYLVYG
jgi:hypothetical protein